MTKPIHDPLGNPLASIGIIQAEQRMNAQELNVYYRSEADTQYREYLPSRPYQLESARIRGSMHIAIRHGNDSWIKPIPQLTHYFIRDYIRK
jgi:hypothetical protein